MVRSARRTPGGTHVLLAVPTLGFSLAATTVGTYLPVIVAQGDGSPTAIAALIAVEGVMALFLPVVIGARSDRLVTPIGGRLPFVLAGVPVMAAALVVVGFQDEIVPALAVVIVLFAAYYIAYEPYRPSTPTWWTSATRADRRAPRPSPAVSAPRSPWSAAGCSWPSPSPCRS